MTTTTTSTQAAPTTDQPIDQPLGSVSWFEIGTPDPAGAQEFYGGLFGWQFAAMDIGVPYDDITTGEGHPLRGGVADTSGQAPGYATFCVVVADVGATLEQAVALGGEAVVGPLALPTGMTVGYLRDRDGNLVGVYSPPTTPAVS